MFPGRGDSSHAERARNVCRSCEVSAECLEYAVANPYTTRVGVWASMGERELRAERRRRRLAVEVDEVA